MPKKNGKRDTQRTETGYEIPVPKREDVFGILDKAAKKRDEPGGRKRRARK
jgi:hypothetical protein